MTTHYDPKSHWSEVAQRIRERQDGNRLAGDDAPYYRYKGTLVAKRLTPKIPVKGLSILDVGCGAGNSLTPLLGKGATRLAGADQSPEMAKLASENVPEADITLIEAGKLPYKDGEFDVVKTCTVLQHDPDELAEAMIAEICRVAEKFVILFEDTEDKATPNAAGTGRYKNYYGRSTRWYAETFKKYGWKLKEEERLKTYASMRMFNLFNRTVSRRRGEGEPYGKGRLLLERTTLLFTRELDKYMPSRNWELTSMIFEKDKD